MSFDAIIITDRPQSPFWLRGHGAHQLASLLREHGYTCLVLDFASVLTYDIWNNICRIAIGSNTRFIGVSTTWMPYRIGGMSFTNMDKKDVVYSRIGGTFVDAIVDNRVEPWIQVAKALNPKIKFIAGGPKIDFYADLPFDNLFVGFSETQLLDYMKDRRRIWPKVIQHDTNAHNNESWDFRKSQVVYTDLDMIEPQETLILEVARGCRFKCAFCSYPLIGRKDFAANAKCEETLYRELNENYQRWGVSAYHIGDDTFNDTINKLRLMQSVTNRLSFKLSLTAYTRIDLIAKQPEQIEILHDIGLISTWMGVDSLHPEASKIIGKGMSVDKIKKALYDVKHVWGDDVYVKIGYIAGLPKETLKELEENIEWLLASPVDAIFVNPLRVVRPGVLPYYSRSDIDINYEKYGYSFVGEDNYSNWVKDDNTGISSYEQAVEISKNLYEYIEKRGKRIRNDPLLRNGVRDPHQYYKKLVDKLYGMV